MSGSPWAFVALAAGFGLILYGITPLSGTTVRDGITERGCLAAIAGIAIVCAITIIKVAP